MKRISIFLGIGLLAVAFSACVKEAPGENDGSGRITSSDDLEVPPGFTFATTRQLDINITTTDLWAKDKIRLDVYDFRPSAGGSRVYTGFFAPNGELNASIEVPVQLRKAYLVRTTPDGSQSLAVADINGPDLSFSFGNMNKGQRKSGPSSTSCQSGCDQFFLNHSGTKNINNNDPGSVYCFLGSTSGKINVNKADVILRICGNANLSSISLNNGSSLEVTDGSILTINQLNLNSSSGQVTIYDAEVNINQNFSPSGNVINYGDLNLAQALSVNGVGTLVNKGAISVDSYVNNNYKIINEGDFTVGQNFTGNGSLLTNECLLDVAGNITFNAPVENEGLIRATGKLTLNGGGQTTLRDGAMIKAAEAVINTSITGNGTTSIVVVEGNTTINGGGSLNGNLEYCDADGVETNTGSINAPAVLACNLYLPATACNPEGHGSPQSVDSDNDGVPDASDLYPNDPNASGQVAYPSTADYATLAIEDLWPNKGDYDFNDLVVNYNHLLVTNANNDVVRIESEFVVMAIGGSYRNGLGFQLNLAPGEVASVTGQKMTQNMINLAANGTEQGQSKATIVVFDNAFRLIPDMGGTAFVNTDPSEAPKQRDTLRLTVNFVNPQPISGLGQAPFNPFVFINSDRGRELHMVNQPPTDLMEVQNFGKGGDASNPGAGLYYRSEKGHPWMLNIVGGFDYPTEKTDIVEAYNYFAPWAQSGGTSHLNWYEDQPGHRVAGKVYPKL